MLTSAHRPILIQSPLRIPAEKWLTSVGTPSQTTLLEPAMDFPKSPETEVFRLGKILVVVKNGGSSGIPSGIWISPSTCG